jgi:hypothetical protein
MTSDDSSAGIAWATVYVFDVCGVWFTPTPPLYFSRRAVPLLVQRLPRIDAEDTDGMSNRQEWKCLRRECLLRSL